MAGTPDLGGRRWIRPADEGIGPDLGDGKDVRRRRLGIWGIKAKEGAVGRRRSSRGGDPTRQDEAGGCRQVRRSPAGREVAALAGAEEDTGAGCGHLGPRSAQGGSRLGFGGPGAMEAAWRATWHLLSGCERRRWRRLACGPVPSGGGRLERRRI